MWIENLTPRETEILICTARHYTAEETAKELYITVNTVKTHLRSIYSKMGVTGRSSAIREATTRGLLTITVTTTLKET